MNDTSKTERQKYSYLAFGLTISSEIEFPELCLNTMATTDVAIIEADLSYLSKPNSRQTWFSFRDNDAVLYWDAIGTFKVTDGCSIIVDRHDSANDDLVAFPLLGPVFAILLHQRKYLLFHASAVSINGQAVCFLGDKGMGKSTTAAAMISCGHSLLSDDIVALKFVDGSPIVLPAFPQLKLMVDAEREIKLENSEARPKAHDQINKNRLLIHQGFSTQNADLVALYIVSQGDQISLKPLNKINSLTSLLRFSYVARFGSELINGMVGKRHLQACSDLANRSLCFELCIPRNLAGLKDVVAFVEMQVTAETDENVI